MKIFLSILFGACLLVGFVGCKTEAETIDVTKYYLTGKVQPKYGTSNLFLDSVYVTPEGYDIKFTDIKFYIQDLKDSTKTIVDAGLFNYRMSNQLFRVEGKPDGITSLVGNIGVDAFINHQDPSSFPNESPLNIAISNDMHWGWSPGYIFLKVEAKVDTIPDGIALFDHSVIFHVGLDANLQQKTFNTLTWVPLTGLEQVLNFELDMRVFLSGPQPIDVKFEHSTHSSAGQEALTLKVAQNFAAALTSL